MLYQEDLSKLADAARTTKRVSQALASPGITPSGIEVMRKTLLGICENLDELVKTTELRK